MAKTTHTAPKTTAQFKAFIKQKSSTVLSDDGDRMMIRRPGSTQQWNWNGSHWRLMGFS